MRILNLFALGLAGAMMLTACAKSSTSTGEASSAPAESTAAESTPATSAAPVSAVGGPGATAYTANCASCHQAGGKGLAGSFPPLAGNPEVTGDPKKVIHIVKYGLTGKVMVGPDSFNGVMPPWGSQLSDAQIASVVTYIRGSWGNNALPVTTADVDAVAK